MKKIILIVFSFAIILMAKDVESDFRNLVDINNRNAKVIRTFTNTEIKKMLNYAKKHECLIYVDKAYHGGDCEYEEIELICHSNEFNSIKSDKVQQIIRYARMIDNMCRN